MIVTTPLDSKNAAPERSFRHAMIHSGPAGSEVVTFADDLSELVTVIVTEAGGDYDLPSDFAGDDEALIARWKASVRIAELAQTTILLAATERQLPAPFDPATCTEAEITTLMGPKNIPVESFIDGDDPDLHWSFSLPLLVLIAVDYEPFTDRRRPAGNVAWIDPSDDESFIRSLDELRLIAWHLRPAE